MSVTVFDQMWSDVTPPTVGSEVRGILMADDTHVTRKLCLGKGYK